MIASSLAPTDPRREFELRAAARHLAAHPLVLSESDPDTFRLVRRYEHDLDRWFTQRLGYRLEVTADTARLFKSTLVARRRAVHGRGSRTTVLGARVHHAGARAGSRGRWSERHQLARPPA